MSKTSYNLGWNEYKLGVCLEKIINVSSNLKRVYI